MKEIIKLCTTGELAEWLRGQWKPQDGDFFVERYEGKIYKPRIYHKNYTTYFDITTYWLPISFDLKHNCLQVERLLMKKLDCPDIMYFRTLFNERDKENPSGKSYVIQCLLWLKELVEKEK